ncbi:OmpH family outer membrane protein [Noviherbaspirillum malthae]|uniref:OmpH family outer membrane protein n=1 Tax=Noviherbaspirillum malthae TaxID=1260987 RepID=UPI00188F5326|nr:OmpH family outer membrane protein [Noviherbaspirillum malthae]
MFSLNPSPSLLLAAQTPLPPSNASSSASVNASLGHGIAGPSSVQRNNLSTQVGSIAETYGRIQNNPIVQSAQVALETAIKAYQAKINSRTSNAETFLTAYDNAGAFMQEIASIGNHQNLAQEVGDMAREFVQSSLSTEALDKELGNLHRRVELLKRLHAKLGDFGRQPNISNLLQSVVTMEAYLAETILAISAGSGNVIDSGRRSRTSSLSAVPVDELDSPNRLGNSNTPPAQAESGPNIQALQFAVLHEEARRALRPASQSSGPRALVPALASDIPGRDASLAVQSRRGSGSSQTMVSETAQLPPMSEQEVDKANRLIEKVDRLVSEIEGLNGKKIATLKVIYLTRKLASTFGKIKSLLGTHSVGDNVFAKQALREHLLLALSNLGREVGFRHIPNDLRNQYARLFQRIMHPGSLENSNHRLLPRRPYAPVVTSLAGNDRQRIDRLRLISGDTARAILGAVRPLRENGGALYFQNRIFAEIEQHWGIVSQ